MILPAPEPGFINPAATRPSSGAIAKVMAGNGTRLWLGGRSQTSLDRIAGALRAAGGAVETFTVDVLTEVATTEGACQLADRCGGFDIVINTTGLMHDQGKLLGELTLSSSPATFPFLQHSSTSARRSRPI